MFPQSRAFFALPDSLDGSKALQTDQIQPLCGHYGFRNGRDSHQRNSCPMATNHFPIHQY